MIYYFVVKSEHLLRTFIFQVDESTSIKDLLNLRSVKGLHIEMPSHSSLIVSAADQMMYPNEFNDSAYVWETKNAEQMRFITVKSTGTGGPQIDFICQFICSGIFYKL